MNNMSARLLVVDDIDSNRKLLKVRLERQGYEVVVADSGQNALVEITRSSFDLVLLDIMMPGLNGLETLERLRRIVDRGTLPVIMVSARQLIAEIAQRLLK